VWGNISTSAGTSPLTVISRSMFEPPPNSMVETGISSAAAMIGNTNPRFPRISTAKSRFATAITRLLLIVRSYTQKADNYSHQ
jgi:hypothetical protein